MSNNRPETKQQFELTSAPGGLPPLRLRLAVGGIATVAVLTELGATKPARADHNPEQDEILDCPHGWHAVWSSDFNEDGQPDPGEYGCFTRPECAFVEPPLSEDAQLTQEQLHQISMTKPMRCVGDPEYNFDSWFEAHPWAQPYRITRPTTEVEQPETTSTTITDEPIEPDDTTTEVEQPETTPTTITDEPIEPDDTTTEVEQPETTPTTITDEPIEPDDTTTEVEQPETTPTTITDEPIEPDDTTTEVEQPETTPTTITDEPIEPDDTTTEVEQPETTPTTITALAERRPTDIEDDTEAFVPTDVLLVGMLGAVALAGSIYLVRAKKIKLSSRSKKKSHQRG